MKCVTLYVVLSFFGIYIFNLSVGDSIITILRDLRFVKKMDGSVRTCWKQIRDTRANFLPGNIGSIPINFSNNQEYQTPLSFIISNEKRLSDLFVKYWRGNTRVRYGIPIDFTLYLCTELKKGFRVTDDEVYLESLAGEMRNIRNERIYEFVNPIKQALVFLANVRNILANLLLPFKEILVAAIKAYRGGA